MVAYKKLTYDNTKIQVDSAIRDGNGAEISAKYQEKLVSGTNIKTLDNISLLGAGNISLSDLGLSSVYVYKGSVADYASLPSTGQQVGDTYNVEAAYSTYPAGTNFAWNGTTWDALGGSVDLSGYLTTSAAASTYQPKLTAGSGISASALASNQVATLFSATDITLTES